MIKGLSLDELIRDCPVDAIIGDNLVRAYAIINNMPYKSIVCTVSGGYDSDIVVDICARCDRDGKISYVWFDTGLKYQATKNHLNDLEKKYGIKIQRIKASKPIPVACREYGLPFLSKRVSENIERLQRYNFQWEDEPFETLLKRYPKCRSPLRWWCNEWGEGSQFNISKNRYLKEFMIDNPPEKIRISPKCCKFAKKDVLKKIIKEKGFDLDITGLRKAEGGARTTRYNSCFQEKDNDIDMYMPIWWYLNETKELYKEHYGVECSKCYSEYRLARTGCAGCPFSQKFEEELEIMRKYESKLYKAACAIFGESYRYTRQYRSYATFAKGFEKEESK